MQRTQNKTIAEDLEKKMVFITGPRQAGKTTLAKSLSSLWPKAYYLTWDAESDRKIILKQEWDRKSPLIIFDEIHKLKNWKSRLKGVYDKEGIPPRILVTGSARLDLYRRGGDSMAGRYFLHHLYPLSIAELKGYDSPQALLTQLMTLGNFPEPFLSQSEIYSKRWRKQHLERIIREDIQDLEPIREVPSLMLLVDLLRDRAGSRISYASLAQDLQVSPHTVKHWIQILEHMYVIFLMTPYRKNLARSILKEPKVYFYDTGSLRTDEGAKLENLIAVSLRKWLHFLEDTQGKETQLCYVRDKEKREVDFLVTIDQKIEFLIEVKNSDAEVSPSLYYFQNLLKPTQSIQLVQNLDRIRHSKGVSLIPAADWLSQLDI
ncbi:MAG: ATP-binding protein [Chlamydiae bacterium]|nr:ATP-binding protein [Chlamydiota bacterium]MBI3277467.1 ATP-binding protein [Chlamydiota bacterium]